MDFQGTTDGPSVIHSGRSFFSITPPVCCLDIVRVVVSPRPSHPFGIPVVWDDVIVVSELFVADCAYSLLLGDFPLQKFPHFGWRSEFSIAPRMMRVFNASNTGLYYTNAMRLLAAAATD